MNTEIPKYVHGALWSYDVAHMDVNQDKQIIIPQVLNYGTYEATQWICSTYTQEDIKKSIMATSASFWNKKSLVYWSMLYDVVPVRQSRFS